MEILQNLTLWHWLIAAAVLLILEAFAPGAIFLWLGVAAAVVGAVMAVMDITWQTQFFIFAILSIASSLAWRQYRVKHLPETDQPALNRRGHHYIGRVFTLEAPIVNGSGKVKVDDSTWKISGADLEAGASVKVVDVDGVVFKVEAVE